MAEAVPEEEEMTVASVHEPSPPEEEKIAEEPAEDEGPIPEGAELVLKPAEERPPEGAPDREPAKKPEERKGPPKAEAVDEEIVAEVNYTGKLSSSSYYLQLAAYQELETAKRLAAKLIPRYPVTIYTGEGETFPYKVMVGPLREDESGALLYSFTARGYRDAFLRRGN